MTTLGLNMTDREPPATWADTKPPSRNGQHPMEWYRLMDDADTCDAKADQFSNEIDNNSRLTAKQRQDLSETACSLYNLASSLRQQARELDDIAAQRRDTDDLHQTEEETRRG